MKRVIIGACFLFSAVAVFSQEQNAALAYLDVIEAQQKAIAQDLWDYTCTMSQGKRASKIKNRRKDLLKTINIAKQEVNSLDAFNGSTQLRDSTLAYFDLSYKVIGEDYAKIVDMQEISEQSYDLMEAYLLAQEKANEKLDIAADIFQKEYEEFAAENNINLIKDESKVSKKLEKASDVYKYYNPVYLIFFKSYKQEMYLMNALQNKDINGIEQNKQTLLKYAQEGIDKIKEISPFKGDASMIRTANALQNFYVQEVEKMNVMVDFFMKEETMNQTKKSYEAKKTKSQADVDAFNKAVNEINKAVKDYNTTNDMLNKKRGELIEDWNSVCEKFTKTHVPKR